MITWIQTRFQTGYKILFFLVLVIVIVAFVFTVGEAPGMGRAGDRGEPQEYFGYNLRSQSDQQEIVRLASISFYINYGRDAGEQLQRYAFERLALLGTGREMGLPIPDAPELQRFISTLPGFSGPRGTFDQQAYQEYLDYVDSDPRISRVDLVRVLEEDYIANQVRVLLGGPGFALPSDVKRQVARQKTEWTLELASLQITDLDVEIEPEEDALETFFENNDFRYEVPPHKVISFATFEIDRFVDQVESPSEDAMRAYFEANRDDFALPEVTEVENDEEDENAEPREVQFEDVSEEIEGILRRNAARRMAREVASDFTFSLFEQQVGQDSPELAALLEEQNLERNRVAPFPEGGRPASPTFSDAIIRDIRRLDEQRYFSDPRDHQGNVVVVFLDEIVPAYIPPFDEVRDRVAADYREEERRRLRAERGNQLYETLNERLAEDMSFIDAAEELEMVVTEYGPFTMMDQPEDLPRVVLGRLAELRQGQVSRMIQENSRAHFVHVVSRTVPEVDETGPEYTQNLDQSRYFSASIMEQFSLDEIQQRAMPRETRAVR